MRSTILKLALVLALLAAVPLAAAQPQFQQARGLVVIQVQDVIDDIDVEIGDIDVRLLTNLLRDADILTDSQVVVSVLGDQIFVTRGGR